ncbi:MAG: FMN-binding glutamate synthase family protein [Sphingomonadales bacterium]
MPDLNSETLQSIEFILSMTAGGFIFVVGCGVLFLFALYIIDKTQKSHAIRRNYPVIGRFRYIFERLGEYFRQYFFAADREELPFNRAERGWAYRAAKKVDTTRAFGSTRDLKPEGSIFFVNTMFPCLDEDTQPSQPIIFGPYCETPYECHSFFNISAMSYGSLSKPAIRALSHGAAEAGIWLNTGEGGLSTYHLEGGCDLVFQIGTAKYGVRDLEGKLSEQHLRTIANHPQVRMFELKLSQGAKPGKGGILPAKKVTREIAEIRGIPEGVASISPNRHPDINSVSDLLHQINHIRAVTGKPTGFKTVIGDFEWLEELCQLILEQGEEYAPDFITIDSADGGTGAAPQPLMDFMGLPIQESLPQVIDILDRHDLRPRIRVIASGKMITPSGVAWALAMGADAVNSARGFMFALGCIQSLQCNTNRCPTGVTTHRADLQRGLDPMNKCHRVANYAARIHEEVGIIAHSCGVPEPRKLHRHHARVVVDENHSLPLSAIYPPQSKHSHGDAT